YNTSVGSSRPAKSRFSARTCSAVVTLTVMAHGGSAPPASSARRAARRMPSASSSGRSSPSAPTTSISYPACSASVSVARLARGHNVDLLEVAGLFGHLRRLLELLGGHRGRNFPRHGHIAGRARRQGTLVARLQFVGLFVGWVAHARMVHTLQRPRDRLLDLLDVGQRQVRVVKLLVIQPLLDDPRDDLLDLLAGGGPVGAGRALAA